MLNHTIPDANTQGIFNDKSFEEPSSKPGPCLKLTSAEVKKAFADARRKLKNESEQISEMPVSSKIKIVVFRSSKRCEFELDRCATRSELLRQICKELGLAKGPRELFASGSAVHLVNKGLTYFQFGKRAHEPVTKAEMESGNVGMFLKLLGKSPEQFRRFICNAAKLAFNVANAVVVCARHFAHLPPVSVDVKEWCIFHRAVQDDRFEREMQAASLLPLGLDDLPEAQFRIYDSEGKGGFWTEALSVLGTVAPWIAGAIAVGIVAYGIYKWGYKEGRADEAKEAKDAVSKAAAPLGPIAQNLQVAVVQVRSAAEEDAMFLEFLQQWQSQHAKELVVFRTVLTDLTRSAKDIGTQDALTELSAAFEDVVMKTPHAKEYAKWKQDRQAASSASAKP
jgi:hypothetical protein